VIKTNSNQRYTTNSLTGFLVREMAKKSETPIQEFVGTFDRFYGCMDNLPTDSSDSFYLTCTMLYKILVILWQFATIVRAVARSDRQLVPIPEFAPSMPECRSSVCTGKDFHPLFEQCAPYRNLPVHLDSPGFALSTYRGIVDYDKRSCREVMGTADLTHGVTLFKGFFKYFRDIDDSIEE